MLGIANNVSNKDYSYFTIYFGVHITTVWIVNLFYNQSFKVCQIGASFLKKKQIASGYRAANCTPSAKKTPKYGSRLGSGDAINGVKL